MIIFTAPMRVSFIGGGTDLPAYFMHADCGPGKVVSSAINKEVAVSVQHTPLEDSIKLKYSETEVVSDVSNIRHTRLRAALQHFNISRSVEITSLSSLPARAGLGSSSSFSVALIASLLTYKGMDFISPSKLAELAYQFETRLVGETLGKQDQYAAALGGANILSFCPGYTQAQPISLCAIQDFWRTCCHLLYLGNGRDATVVLAAESRKIASDKATRQLAHAMTLDVIPFAEAVAQADYLSAGELIHKNWQRKRQLAPGISTPIIDTVYNEARRAGAYGGKLLGAGAAGCMLLVCKPEHKNLVLGAALECATSYGLKPELLQVSPIERGIRRIL